MVIDMLNSCQGQFVNFIMKCDASESTSCTECINRKVRCQFTKETNRRMSSIKFVPLFQVLAIIQFTKASYRQVQDLEKQLLTTKQQLDQLRSGGQKLDDSMDLDVDANGLNSLPLPDSEVRGPRRTQTTVLQNLSDVRSNLKSHGGGIVGIPAPYRHEDSVPLSANESPTLPPKNAADHLLSQYYLCVHSYISVLHWPSFVEKYEQIYQTGSLAGVSRSWTASLFGVFACASLYTHGPDRVQEGKEYIKICYSLLDIFKDKISMDQVRASLLVSVFLFEVGSKTASWVWMGSAVRLGQELGLHVESGSWPAAEVEMRRCIWWSLYCWDRCVSRLTWLMLILMLSLGFYPWKWERPS